MAEAENLIKTLKYIEEREKNLSRYSDKLRQAWVKISNVFGLKKCCRVCGNYEDYKAHHHYRYKVKNKFFETKEEALKYAKSIEPHFTAKIVPANFDVGRWADPSKKIIYVREINDTYTHNFVPKIEVSIDIIDDKPFYSDKENKYYLAIIDHELKISEIPDVVHDMYRYVWTIWGAPRWLLKELTKSGRLPKFLYYVARKLEKAEKEYREVSEIAEKLAKVVGGM